MVSVDFSALDTWKNDFMGTAPFDHVVIDNFLPNGLAAALENDFPVDKLNELYSYNNPLEHKFASNNWNLFPPTTYAFLEYINSAVVVEKMSLLCGVQLSADFGLHGGGWHIHGDGGKLNPHLDYSIHPKLGLQRKLNLILYLSSDWKEEFGGHLGFWSNDANLNQPAKLEKEIAVGFNRALIFDTSQHSWHGISRMIKAPEGCFRKSLAIYYLCKPAEDAPSHARALYAPTEEQKADEAILEMIRKRVDVANSAEVYRTK